MMTARCLLTDRRQSGSALIAVLALLFTAGIITTATVAISRMNTFDISSHLELQRSMYIAEGAANRIQFLISADANLYPGEALGYTDYAEYTHDRFLADGVEHYLDYYGTPLKFVITDALGGLNFTGTNYRDTLTMLNSNYIDDTAWTEELDILKKRLDDYRDSDDSVQEDSLESAEYEELFRAPLPRQDALQFREELLWIPGFRDLIAPDRDGRLSRVRLIPPANTVNENRGRRPSLFSADLFTLRTYTGLTEDEAKTVLEALEQWKTERRLLTDSLDAELLAGLSKFSGNESGYYTVVIEPDRRENDRPFRKLAFSYENFPIGGPENQVLKYLEWMLY